MDNGNKQGFRTNRNLMPLRLPTAYCFLPVFLRKGQSANVKECMSHFLLKSINKK
jgi:hypothetical protein